MLKFENLFENIEMAEMIAKLWGNDNVEVLENWRVSSNAIYPFKYNGETYYLRVVPQDEKDREGILAELHFLNYLHENEFDAVKPVASKNENFLEVISNEWGEYYAVVFKKVQGQSMEDIELTSDQFKIMGITLGKLHNLSSKYKHKEYKRKDFFEILDWVESDLIERKDEVKAIKEIRILREFFKGLEVNRDNFGLIHYDFQLDNLFLDTENEKVIPIDFDDSMYHWYAMDLENSLNSIRCCSYGEIACEAFIEGYRLERTFTQREIDMLPIFKRFADLYRHVRLLKASETTIPEEPSWMSDLRVKIEKILSENRLGFGREISL